MSRVYTLPELEAHTPANKIAILRGVVDWLEANPDKALVGKFATDYSGWPCEPRVLSATCFCFIGRLQHDTGLSTFIDGLPLYLSDIGANQSALAMINDRYDVPGERFAKLREYIDELEERIAA